MKTWIMSKQGDCESLAMPSQMASGEHFDIQLQVEKVVYWAKKVGLDVRKIDDVFFPSFDTQSFIENVWTDEGIVYYNDLTLAGSLLHEIGHVAVTPALFRPYLRGDLDLEENPDALDLIDSLYRSVIDWGVETSQWKAFIHGDEQAAIAWSFAAARAAGVDDFLPFKQGFGLSGKDLHTVLKMSANEKKCYHPGIACLFHGGLLRTKLDFPNLSKWLQE